MTMESALNECLVCLHCIASVVRLTARKQIFIASVQSQTQTYRVRMSSKILSMLIGALFMFMLGKIEAKQALNFVGIQEGEMWLAMIPEGSEKAHQVGSVTEQGMGIISSVTDIASIAPLPSFFQSVHEETSNADDAVNITEETVHKLPATATKTLDEYADTQQASENEIHTVIAEKNMNKDHLSNLDIDSTHKDFNSIDTQQGHSTHFLRELLNIRSMTHLKNIESRDTYVHIGDDNN